MKIKQARIYEVMLPLKQAFKTSFGTIHKRTFLIVEVEDEDGRKGYGEGVAFDAPWYTEETVETSKMMIRDFLLPLILNKEIHHPEEVFEHFRVIQRNPMAKAAVECAIWDVYAKQQEQPLHAILGGTQQAIAIGAAIGLQETEEQLLQAVQQAITKGYKRIKVKIKPGQDFDILWSIRQAFPDIPLMADANSAYTWADRHHLKTLDQLNLLMIEQPLGASDIVEHAKLQKQLQTPICLDESITSLEDAKAAIELGSTQIINIKVGRVGGLAEAKRIHDYCAKNEIPVWSGGMLESGIGRGHSLALASLPNFIYPADTAGSSRYWEQDIVSPVAEDRAGKIQLSSLPGLGYPLEVHYLKQASQQTITITS